MFIVKHIFINDYLNHIQVRGYYLLQPKETHEVTTCDNVNYDDINSFFGLVLMKVNNKYKK